VRQSEALEVLPRAPILPYAALRRPGLEPDRTGDDQGGIRPETRARQAQRENALELPSKQGVNSRFRQHAFSDFADLVPRSSASGTQALELDEQRSGR
jgi:hypothetical protein